MRGKTCLNKSNFTVMMKTEKGQQKHKLFKGNTKVEKMAAVPHPWVSRLVAGLSNGLRKDRTERLMCNSCVYMHGDFANCSCLRKLLY